MNRNSLDSIKSLDTITSMNLEEYNVDKCLKDFISNTPSSLEFIDMSSFKNISKSDKKRNEKLMDKSINRSILSIYQKNDFLKFLIHYKEITNLIISIVEIEYYIKAYNKCFENKVPVFDLKKFLFSKNHTLDEVVLFNDYTQLIEISKSGRKELLPRRNALVKSSGKSYSDLSKIMSKYQFGQQINGGYSQKAGNINMITDEKEIINILKEHIGGII